MFCYFHFAASRELTAGCLNSGITAVAYETLNDAQGRLPLLTPMSEIAGRMSVQEGAKCLERPMMGRGILLGGVPGVAPANVLVLGGGVVGTNAARVAAGLLANVTLMDINLDRLRYLDEVMPANVTTIFSDPHTVEEYIVQADLVIGAVLIPGDRAPVLVNRRLVKKMKPGSVIVDVSIDQGGCTETSRPTTHSDPIYIVDGVVHYCVTNIPGAVEPDVERRPVQRDAPLRPPARATRRRRLRRPHPRPRRRDQHAAGQAPQHPGRPSLPGSAKNIAVVSDKCSSRARRPWHCPLSFPRRRESSNLDEGAAA